MSTWMPHATVACVIAHEGKYLLVEERDKRSSRMVFNQPAGHLEDGESLHAAALRETLEETGWIVMLQGIISIALYQAASSGDTYYRTTFLAVPVERDKTARLDPDIHAVHWLAYEEIVANSARMRSPLVLSSIERHRRGLCYPLEIIDNA